MFLLLTAVIARPTVQSTENHLAEVNRLVTLGKVETSQAVAVLTVFIHKVRH